MTAAVTEVAVNGTALPLTSVEWDLTITHGRTSIAEDPRPSTAQLVLLYTATDTLPDVFAGTLTVSVGTAARFTGTITGLKVTHEPGPAAAALTRLTVTAEGNLARLRALTTGDAGFAEETAMTRAAAILAATGLTYSVSSDDGTVLLAEDPDIRTVADYLTELCLTTGATMADLPDGTVLLEAYTRRADNYTAGTWTAAGTATWATYGGAWQSGRLSTTLTGDQVLWEPEWVKDLGTVVNDVTVAYGAADPQDTATATDPASVTRYGKRSAALTTQIKTLTDAQARADAILTAQAEPHWDMQAITVPMDLLDAATHAELLAAETGDRVTVLDVPRAAPEDSYFGVIEGWTERHTADAGHRLTLYLSDPRFSFAVCAWSDVSASLTWGAVNLSVMWGEVATPSDLL